MAARKKPRKRGRPSKTTTVRSDDIAILSRKKGRETKRLKSRTGWSFRFIDDDDLAPYLDASWLLADVSAALHAHTVFSIESGRRSDTGAAQPPLDPRGQQGRLARRGVRPRFRGVNKHPSRSKGTMLHERLSRTRIIGRDNAKVGKGKIGTAARCEIKPGFGLHSAFLADELGRGVDYLHVDGEAARVIDKAVSEWLDKALDGPPTNADLPEFGVITGNDIL